VDRDAQSCKDEHLEDLLPYVPKLLPEEFIKRPIQNFSLKAFDEWDEYGNVLFHWQIHRDSFKLNWTNPTYRLLANNEPINDPHYAPFRIPASDGWFVLIIDGNYSVKTRNEDGDYVPIKEDPKINHRPIGGRHPIHLHGHDFMVIAQEEAKESNKGEWWTHDAIMKVINENWHKFHETHKSGPPRRDTALLPDKGILVVAWANDNPGAWLMHCHIAWHVSNGFAMQFIERGPEIVPQLKDGGSYDQFMGRCEDWGIFANHTWAHSHDSGV